MKYGYTIIYVSSVEETLKFYQRAFGFNIKMLHGSKTYGELDTGGTVLAFASHELADINLEGKYIKGNIENKPFGMELAFVTEDIESAYEKAITQGAVSIKVPEEKPWGQVVGYVRAIDGSIIELCTPMVLIK